MICEPLELEYLYSYLTEFGHNVIILDMILEKHYHILLKNINQMSLVLPHILPMWVSLKIML